MATGASEGPKTDDLKDPAAVALGRKGGLKGGKARAESLSPTRRAEIAKAAASARWRKTAVKRAAIAPAAAQPRRKPRTKISTPKG